MKTIRLSALVISLGVIAFSVHAQRSDYTDQRNDTVTVENATGVTFVDLYFSPSISEEWHDNFLGTASLEPGARMTIHLRAYPADAYLFDVMAIDDEDAIYAQYEIDIRYTDTIVLTDDDIEGFGEQDMMAETEASGYDDAYNQGYMDGYRNAYLEGFRDGYRQGFGDGLQFEETP